MSILVPIALLSLLVIAASPLIQVAWATTGSIDLIKCSDGTLAKWTTSPVTYAIVNVAQVPSNYVTDVQNGVNEWTTVQNTYTLQSAGSGSALITIKLYFKIIPGYILGATLVNCASQSITSVEIDLGVKGLSDTGVKNVAAHEFGHALGLGHASLSGDLMYASFDRTERKTAFCPSNLDVGGLTATSTPYTVTNWARLSC